MFQLMDQAGQSARLTKRSGGQKTLGALTIFNVPPQLRNSNKNLLESYVVMYKNEVFNYDFFKIIII